MQCNKVYAIRSGASRNGASKAARRTTEAVDVVCTPATQTMMMI